MFFIMKSQLIIKIKKIVALGKFEIERFYFLKILILLKKILKLKKLNSIFSKH